MKRVQTILKSWIESDEHGFIRTFLLSEGFGFCLCLSFVCGYFLDRYDSVSEHMLPVLVVSLVTGTPVACVMTFYYACRRLLVYDKTHPWIRRFLRKPAADGNTGADMLKMLPDEKVSVKVWLTYAAVIFVCWIPVWLAYYPVIFAYDAETQLSQMISGVFSTHHPLFHTLWLGTCMKLTYDAFGINGGMVLYALTQMIVMALIFGWTISEAYRVNARKALVIVYAVFLAVFPVHAILAVSVTKDVVFSGLVLVFAVLVRRVSGSGEADRKLLIKIAVSAGFMCLFRNNAVYALVLMSFIILIRTLGSRKASRRYGLILAIFIGTVAGFLCCTGLKLVLHADSGSPREALSIPIQQMARVRTLYADKLDPEMIRDLDEILSPDASSLYDEHLADPVKKAVNLKSSGTFIKSWFNLLPKFPGAYLDAWLLTTKGAWHIYDTSVNEIYGKGGGFGYLSTDTRYMPEGFRVEPAPVLPWLRNALESLVSDNAFESVPVIRLLFAPAIYVWISSAYLCGAIVRRKKVCINASLILVTLYITILMGPAILVRYMYPYMIALSLPFMGYDNT